MFIEARTTAEAFAELERCPDLGPGPREAAGVIAEDLRSLARWTEANDDHFRLRKIASKRRDERARLIAEFHQSHPQPARRFASRLLAGELECFEVPALGASFRLLYRHRAGRSGGFEVTVL